MHLGTRLRSLAVAAVALLVSAPASALAQGESSADPVIVVSITNMDRLMKNVNYVTTAIEQPQAGGMFQMMSGMYTNGVDRSRPIGIVFPMVDQMPAPLAFIPTDDVEKVLQPLEAMLGPPDPLEENMWALAAGASLIYVKQQGDWAYMAQSQELLQSLPSDPLPWLDGMNETYDVGVQLNLTALTPEQRSQAIELMRQGFESALAQQPPEQAAQVQQMGEQSLAQLETVINDTETFQFGFAIQPDQQRLLFEGVSTAVPGSDLAKMLNGQRSIPSKFAPVIQPQAAAYFHSAASISGTGIEQAKASLEQATGSIRGALASAEDLSDEDRAELEAFFDRMIELGKETVEEGKGDSGLLVSLDNQELNAVTGFFVSDGSKVAQLAKDLAAKIDAKTQGQSPVEFKFDAGSHEGVTLHYVEAQVPESEDEARQIFGDTLRLVIGTGDDAVYLALGKQGESLLKGLINAAGDDTGGDRPLAQGSINMMPILEFAQSINANESVAAMIDTLASYEESDAVSFESVSIERGSRGQVTIGEGILRAIGAAIMANQPEPQPAF
jgi:hypothetical protein